MRVILVNRYFYPDESATSRMASSLAFGLQRRGYEVQAIASCYFHNGPGRLPVREIVNGVRVRRIGGSRLGGWGVLSRIIDYATFHMAAGWAIRRAARRGDVVIVGTDPPLLSVTALVALAKSGAVLVNWMFDLFPEAALKLGLLKPNRQGRLLCWLRDLSLKGARANVAPMRSMADLLIRRGISPEKMSVIHCWSDGDAIVPRPRGDNPLRNAWGLGRKFVVAYSGNFGRVHEFETILDAAERMRGDHRIAFVLIGDGHRRAWVESEVKRRGLDNVMLKPLQPRERLSESLGLADAHLISLRPDLEECSVPSKLYGILAAGRPVLFIGDPRGEVATVIERAGCGIAVPPGQSERLVRAIVRLVESEAAVRAMAAAARREFELRYTSAAGIEDWEKLLVSLAAAPGRDFAAAPATTA